MAIKTNPYNDSLVKYPRIEDMVRTINQMTTSEMYDATEVEKIPLPARLCLLSFFNDWHNDPSHELYMKFIPDGFSKGEALMMGDLLSFAMVGGRERKKDQQNRENEFIKWKRWNDELQPFYKKLPSELKITDLTGLHITLLQMLPQNSYNWYTLPQMFADDPTLLPSLVGEKIKITPLEFEALSMLQRIVETGSIEQFKLGMAQGSRASLLEMAKQSGQDIGKMILSAFKEAQQAVRHFERGDFALAIEKLDQLNSNYGIGTDSFAAGIDNMFVATLASVYRRSNKLKTKGITDPVMMSLDTSFRPEGFPETGFKGGAQNAAARVRQAASSAPYNWTNNGFSNGYNDPKLVGRGTFGLRPVSLAAGGGQNKTYSGPFIVTDWYALFAAFGFAEEKELPNNWAKNNNLRERVFANKDSRPMLRFVIHGHLGTGLDDLMPEGLLTVALTYNGKDDFSGDNVNLLGSDSDNSKGAIPNVIVDMFYQDFLTGERKWRKDKLIASISTPDEEVDFDNQELFESLDIGSVARRKATKKPSKKKVTQGQMIAIDLTPSSQVRLSKVSEKSPKAPHYMKELNKEDSDFKDLWEKYAKGNKPIRGRVKGKIGWKWRGKVYRPTKADKARDPKMSKPPASLVKAISKEGTYADYKSGKANMRLLYAPRKDNNNMVPFRLLIPQILIRHDPETNQIIAKKGSSDTAKMQKLLNRLETDFGKLEFKRKNTAVGGFDRYPAGKEKGDKKDPRVRVDRGVSKVFQAKGLETPDERFTTKAHPSGIKPDGSMIYSAMTRGGQSVEMEVR